ncbi:hypothetical protein CA54_31050 [Symmachiella macrocystis]|uniref:Uncharacterized protein n=1 Tax=Symmachiella macrocystis TaxID=2527985 RepID=A0A5C6BRB4_9PLAN|nr:hypothetical protein [Symmachiella macrocystis]TWU14262.1 hypothetical protein CA54_31050 [Symmachiella macrocystis]
MRSKLANNPTGRRGILSGRRMPQIAADRGGSVLIAVLWLMALLWVLGIFFFLFANTEQNAAQHYSDAAKVDNRCGVDPDVLWDWALRQLIVGANFDDDGDFDISVGNLDTESESALYVFDNRNRFKVTRHSILGHVLGNDLHAYNGEGIHLITDINGNPAVDQDRDGVADADQSLLETNYSAVTNGGTPFDVSSLSNPPPTLDAGYTSPDINAPFLAYLGTTPDGTQVLKPSFHNPQYLRDGGAPITDWDTANTIDFSRRVFRPHVNHQSMDSAGTPYSRYLTSQFTKPDGVIVEPFQFTNNATNIFNLNEGVWTGAGTIEYDADPDGDGVKEAVWMDLGFPLQECDGKLFKTMFAVTVLDADGLLNVNVAGNTTGTRFIMSGDFDPTTGVRFNQSNQGLSPSELSLHYAFSADPLTVADTNPAWNSDRAMFGINPAAIDREALANMETFKLLHGSATYTEPTPGTYVFDSALAGRYGDIDLLNDPSNGVLLNVPPNPNPNLYPQPGTPGADDDGDENQVASNDPYNPFTLAQPLDISGGGLTIDISSGFGTQPVRPTGIADPFRWLQYNDYAINPAAISYEDIFANLAIWTAPNMAPATFQRDEADEMFVLPGNEDILGLASRDAAFSVEEMAGLHKSDNDPDANLVNSRLKELLPITLGATVNADLRKQFTTSSWDMRRFGRAIGDPTAAPAVARPWEFNDDVTVDFNRFPPQFGDPFGTPVPPSRHEEGTASPLDPFRPEVRRLLTIEIPDPANTDPSSRDDWRQGRLSLNQILVGFDTDGTPIYRDLTPHPTNPTAGGAQIQPMVHQNLAPMTQSNISSGDYNAALPYPFGTYPADGVAQEWWARYDRQRLARDIYVLLYTLGGGTDFDVTAGPPQYSAEQLEEMAQFAVNYVDSMDADNVITRFEYDGDLSDGWSPGAGLQVYGVEAQQLTFSEVLGIRQPQILSNHTATLHDELNKDHYSLHIELRNASPHQVDLNDGTWRIRRNDEGSLDNGVIDVGATNENAMIFGSGAGTVSAGGQYTIAINDGDNPFPIPNQLDQHPADFRVDFDQDGDYDLICPNVADTGIGNATAVADPAMFPGPLSNLDTSHSSHDDGRFSLAWEAPNPATPDPNFRGDFLNPQMTSLGTLNISQFELVLERRQNLDPSTGLQDTGPNPNPDDSRNKWIEVDRIVVEFKLFGLEQGDTAPQIPGRLETLKSSERVEPFAQDNPLPTNTTAAPSPNNRYNSVGLAMNSVSPANFQMWQPHFDRYYSSAMELLSVPLYGPDQVIQKLAQPMTLPLRLGFNPTGLGDPAGTRRRIAQEKFLFPELDNNPSNAPVVGDNRWYRLFEFVEVPTRMHELLGDPGRVPGKINLNTIRHMGPLGAMIDGPRVHGLDLLSLDPTDSTSTVIPGQRDWWREFLAARDAVLLPDGTPVAPNGRDPVTGEYLPGLAGSRPFRDFAQLGAGDGLAINDTLLRSLPGDDFGVDQTGRRLFEVGSRAQHDGSASPSTDYYMRHRLLSKVANHATTRSHVYIVFVEVGFFEVVEPTPGQPQISGTTTSTGHRGFFVVDVSDPLGNDAYSPGTSGSRGRFDFRKFVKYRRTIE